MKTLGPLYVDTLKLKHPIRPVFEWGWTQETEYPYRVSAVCIVFWLPFIPRGVAFGVLGKPQTEEDALNRALQLRDLNLKASDVREWDV